MDQTNNPYAAPAAVPEAKPRRPFSVRVTLGDAWQLFAENFAVIVAAVFTVWIPLELFSSYMDYFVFDPDDLRSSFRLTQFLEGFIGIIATAAVISIGITATSNGQPRFSEALIDGLKAWPRMWWTRLLSGLAILASLLLLIIPGIYVAVRLWFAETVAVVEKVSGVEAIRRSFDLTADCFWYTFRLCIVMLVTLILLSAVAVEAVLLFPQIDNWIVDACLKLVVDIVAAYFTLCFFCGYRDLSK